MLNVVKILLLTSILTACSWTDALNMLSPSKGGGIDTELVVGDKSQSVVTEIGGQEAETITNVTDSNNFLLVLAMLGWFLPSPQEMYKMWRSRNASK